MSFGKQVFSGLAWSAVQRLSVQVIQFILGIILARLLTPKEYGTIGILSVFIALSQVFIDSGFTKALIQKQDRSNDDISTVFLFNIIIGVLSYFVLWILAPFIAGFYEMDVLTSLLRVLAVSLVINALFTVPQTLLTINLDFKTLTKINLIASILSGVVAVFMAYVGYGVWALVAQSLISAFMIAVLTWLWTKWMPNWVFSRDSLKTLFSFGSKLLLSSLLGSLVSNFYNLFIAKLLSTKDLGYYTRGSQFSTVFSNIIGSVLDSVLLPALSQLQDQRNLLVANTKIIIKSTALIAIPIFFGLAVIAEPLVKVLLTEKWLPAVPILQIICFARLITNISGVNVNLLYALGKTDLALKQQYYKLSIRIIFILAAIKFGIVYIALAELISTAIHFFINTYYPGKIMNYNAFEQIKDMRYSLIAGIFMLVPTFLEVKYLENDILKLLTIPLTGAIVYGFSIYFLKAPEAYLLLDKIKGLRRN